MILKEEIYGNMATVYHRSNTEPEKFDNLLKKSLWQSGRGAGNLYGLGLYTVFSLSSNNNAYGYYVYKFYIKGIKNFYIFLPDIYNKVWGTTLSYDEIVAEQNKRFGVDVKDYRSFVNSSSKLHSKVKGIIFHGNNDGDVAIIFEPRNAIPVAWSTNVPNGKRSTNFSAAKVKWNKFGMDSDYNRKALNSGIEDYFSPIKKEIQKAEVGDFIDCGGGYKIKKLKISMNKLYKLDEKDRENLNDKDFKIKYEVRAKLNVDKFDDKVLFNEKYVSFAYSIYKDGKYFGVAAMDTVSNKYSPKAILMCHGEKSSSGIPPLPVKAKFEELYEPHYRDKNAKKAYTRTDKVKFASNSNSVFKVNNMLPQFLTFVSTDVDNNIVAENPLMSEGKATFRLRNTLDGILDEMMKETGASKEEIEEVFKNPGDKYRVIMNFPSGELTAKGKPLNKFLPYFKKKLDEVKFKTKFLMFIYESCLRPHIFRSPSGKYMTSSGVVQGGGNNKLNARSAFEKKQREAQGKYIGRNQYRDIREEMDYFGY